MRIFHVHPLIALLVMISPALPAAEIHVPAEQPTIQAGIDAAAHQDTVIVADGVYTGEGNRNLDFGGKRITVRSANGPAACIIDCEGDGSAEVRRAFHFHGYENRTAVVQGFTIRNGQAPSGTEPLENRGGAFYIEDSSPTITGNVITGCRALRLGGAIFFDYSSALVSGNTFQGNHAGKGGAIACTSGATPEISDNVITGNSADDGGAGIYVDTGPSPVVISSNLISDNTGDGIWSDDYALATISGNTITGNIPYGIRCRGLSERVIITGNQVRNNPGSGAEKGGGIYIGAGSYNTTVWDNVIADNSIGILISGADEPTAIINNMFTGNYSTALVVDDCNPRITNNCFHGNHCGGDTAGAISCSLEGAEPLITNCTFSDNSSSFRGGALSVFQDAHPTVSSCIFWGNNAPTGKEIYVGEQSVAATLTIDYSDVDGGQASVHVDDMGLLEWGDGMIDADPLFVTGPWGGYYLSQVSSGQPVDSPCVDAGNPAGNPVEGTTRTDGEADSGIVDQGYHHPLYSPLMLVAGPGPAYDNPPQVRIFPARDGASHVTAFPAYGAPHYGVNVACGHLTGNVTAEILTGPGPGAIFGPHVRGFEGDGTPLPGLSFIAYGTNKYGVLVAAGDLDGDGHDEVITGPGPGEVFGPHVRAFDYAGGAVSPLPGVSFFAYGTLKWGVDVAAGDIDGDGYDEIVTGAGPGPIFGPHVRGWNVDGGPASAIPSVSFMAYGSYHYGVRVSCGDLDGDGMAELVTAPGPSPAFATHVRGWDCDGGTVTPLPGCSFFAWDPAMPRYGARVFAGEDLTQDGRADMAVAPGPDPAAGTPVRVFSYTAGAVTHQFSLDAFPSGITSGASVAAGNLRTASVR